MSVSERTVYELILEGKLQEERELTQQLRTEFEKARAEVERGRRIIKEIWDTFYGQNLRLENWHRNGDLEPVDKFFEENDWSEQPPEPAP